MQTRRLVPLAVAALAGAVAAPIAFADNPAAADRRPSTYLVGAGVESINPTADMLAGNTFFLGGYGIASGNVAGQQTPYPGRYATGIMPAGDGVHVRAVSFGVPGGKDAIELAQIETQGYFSAYKQGPFGIEEIRKHAAAAIAAEAKQRGLPAPTAGSILVDSNHSHGGPDTAGVWGGVPTSYLKLIHDQSVKALVDAWRSMLPARVKFGTAHAGVAGEPDLYPAPGGDPLLTNQFSYDAANKVVDDEIRVLQATSLDGDPIVTYVNFSAHPTVLGSDNTLVTADYTGVLSDLLAQRYGGVGFEQVATLGRTQPNRAGCPKELANGNQAHDDACALEQYAGRVARRVALALDSAKPLTGPARVSLHSYLMTDTVTNAPILALSYGGYAATAPIYRAVNPPWFTANEMGAPAFSGNIGDLLISGGPGEMYPQIVDTVRKAVGNGARGFLNVGTAGDFLGYIVSPISAYPEPIRRSLFDGAPFPTGNDCSGVPSPVGCPSPVDNDNYFFNVSHTFGPRLTCTLLRGAGEALAGDGAKYWGYDPTCAAFTEESQKPADLDTTFPDQPDLSSVLTH